MRNKQGEVVVTDQVRPRMNPISTFLSLRLFIYEGWSEKGVGCSMHLGESMNKSSILVEAGQVYQTRM